MSNPPARKTGRRRQPVLLQVLSNFRLPSVTTPHVAFLIRIWYNLPTFLPVAGQH